MLSYYVEKKTRPMKLFYFLLGCEIDLDFTTIISNLTIYGGSTVV